MCEKLKGITIICPGSELKGENCHKPSVPPNFPPGIQLYCGLPSQFGKIGRLTVNESTPTSVNLTMHAGSQYTYNTDSSFKFDIQCLFQATDFPISGCTKGTLSSLDRTDRSLLFPRLQPFGVVDKC